MKDAQPQTRKKVVIALRIGYQDQYDRYNGIMRWLAGHQDGWDVRLIREKLDLEPLKDALAWGAKGVITGPRISQSALRFLAGSDLPVVATDLNDPGALRRRTSRFAFITTDSEAIGNRAAEYLLGQGEYRSFAFIGSVPEWPWSKRREGAFRRTLLKHGKACHVCPDGNVSGTASGEQRRLAAWLRELPKPAAVFVACDRRAEQVLEVCHLASIRVPDEVALLGVDNETIICTHTRPTLSSIEPDFEEGGFQAARHLDRIMRGLIRKPVTVRCNVRQVVGRGSTAPSSPSGRLVQKACEFIRGKACEGIGAADVARHLGVSRRLADLRFRQLQGRSILDAIQEIRLERVSTLLRTTTLVIGAIGELCGYPTENYLKQRFRKTFGLTMRDYRKRHRMD